jgi:hypothetical protein
MPMKSNTPTTSHTPGFDLGTLRVVEDRSTTVALQEDRRVVMILSNSNDSTPMLPGTIKDPAQLEAFNAYIVAKASLKALWSEVERKRGHAYTLALMAYMERKEEVSSMWLAYERQYLTKKS